MQSYLDFEEYKALGGQLDEISFNRVLPKSQSTIDYFTNQKLTEHDFTLQPQSTQERVKQCLVHLVYYLSQFVTTTYASMSNGGVSVSYKNAADQQKESYDLISSMLDGALDVKNRNLLYRG